MKKRDMFLVGFLVFVVVAPVLFLIWAIPQSQEACELEMELNELHAKMFCEQEGMSFGYFERKETLVTYYIEYVVCYDDKFNEKRIHVNFIKKTSGFVIK